MKSVQNRENHPDRQNIINIGGVQVTDFRQGVEWPLSMRILQRANNEALHIPCMDLY